MLGKQDITLNGRMYVHWFAPSLYIYFRLFRLLSFPSLLTQMYFALTYVIQIYNRVFIRLTTHKDRRTGLSGLSELDLEMATACDREAYEVGGLVEGSLVTEESREVGNRLIDKVKLGSDG